MIAWVMVLVRELRTVKEFYRRIYQIHYTDRLFANLQHLNLLIRNIVEYVMAANNFPRNVTGNLIR